MARAQRRALGRAGAPGPTSSSSVRGRMRAASGRATASAERPPGLALAGIEELSSCPYPPARAGGPRLLMAGRVACGTDGRRRPRARDDRAAPAPRPLRTRSTRPATSARRRSCSPACCATRASRSSCSAAPRSGPNLVARLRGAGDGPTLCLLSHVDTVLADADEWQRDPWSGDVVDGVLWGRGAHRHEVADGGRGGRGRSRWPARAGARRAATCSSSCVVDEETGGGEGAIWLTEHHPDAVRCDLLLNEGAGARHPVRRRARLRRLRGREGRLPLHGDAPTASPATPRCRRSATTRC